MNSRLYQFKNQNVVTTDDNVEVTPIDDDYVYYKNQLEDLTNPLSDDYNKYDNE